MKTLLALLALVSIPARADISDLFHLATCNAFLASRADPKEIDRLGKWLDVEVPKVFGLDFEIHLSKGVKKRIYAALAGDSPSKLDTKDLHPDWDAAIWPSEHPTREREVFLFPYGDRFQWVNGLDEPVRAEFVIHVIEHGRYDSAALDMTHDDPLPIVIERARVAMGLRLRVDRVSSPDSRRGMRSTYLRIASASTSRDQLRLTLELTKELEKRILAFPTNGDSRSHRED